MTTDEVLLWLNRPQETRDGYCRCGCGKLSPVPKSSDKRKGYVRGVPLPYCRGHQNRKSISVVVDEASGCWIWVKSIGTHGYGQLAKSSRGGVIAAYKMVWEKLNGTVPDGLMLDHKCRNRLCVNPEHLRIVNNTENVRCGLKTKLTSDRVKNIKAMYRSGMTCRQVAVIEGISPRHVSSIMIRQTWKDID